MKTKLRHWLSALCLLTSALSLPVFAQGTAFTYQGRLHDSANPVNGFYDLRFAIYDAGANGNALGSTLTFTATPVSNGLFTVALDFGNLFDGSARWLEIGVQTNGAGSFTTLSPRQQLTATPYAVTAGTVTGTITEAQLPANSARLNVANTASQATGTATVTSGFVTGANVTFAGSGYLTPPTVTVNAGLGSGAIVTAGVLGGAVVSLTVADAGSGYTSGATLTIAPPPSNGYQVFTSTNYFTTASFLTNANNTFVGNFTGDGAGLTNLPAWQFTSNASAATNLFGAGSGSSVVNTQGLTTVLFETNSVRIGNVNRSNGVIHVKDGAIWMPSAGWGAANGFANNKHAGKIAWHGDVGTNNNFPISDDSNETGFAKLQGFYHWGGTVEPNPWVILTASNIRLEEGWSHPFGFGGEIHIGNEDHFGSVHLNYVPIIHEGGVSYNTDGYSHPLQFNSVYTIGEGGFLFSSPTIRGRPTRTGLYGPGGNQQSMGELEFMTYPPIARGTYITNAYTDYPGLVVGKMLTNGWDFRGRLIQEQIAYTYETTNVALNFNAPFAQSITLIGNGTNLVTLTNVQGGSTNFESRVFKIQTGLQARDFIWPAGWTVVSESGATVLPPQVAALKILHLRMESWGFGDTNIVAHFGIGTDNTFAIDADAGTFFTRAGVSDAIQKSAVDYLAKSLKANNLWTNIAALYPFVGGSSNSHAMNLKSTSYNVTFTSSGVTHDANGITGNGSSGYGNTGLNPLTHLGASCVSNSHLMVYCRTQTGVSGNRYASVVNTGGTYRFGLTQNGTSLETDGPMNASSPGTYNYVNGDFRGVLGVSRNGSDANSFFVMSRSSISAQSNAATGVPDYELAILARNWQGSGADNHSSANLALLSVGWGYTSNELFLVRHLVENYQAILGRRPHSDLARTISTTHTISNLLKSVSSKPMCIPSPSSPSTRVRNSIW